MRRRAFQILVVSLTLAALYSHFGRRGRDHIPVRGVMGSAFGREIRYQDCGFHTGQDWFAPAGTNIHAVNEGLVRYVGPLWLAGPRVGRGDMAIVIEHEGYITTYSHNRAAFVSAGERVARGQVIGEVGSEGYSGGPHLHFEKIVTPYTGDWRRPFLGCEGYVDPGMDWALW